MDMLNRAHPMAWVATNQAPPLHMQTQTLLGSKSRLLAVAWDGLKGQSALEEMQEQADCQQTGLPTNALSLRITNTITTKCMQPSDGLRFHVVTHSCNCSVCHRSHVSHVIQVTFPDDILKMAWHVAGES